LLLNPNDRTASLPVARPWSHTPIAWPAAQPKGPAGKPAAPSQERWDDSGWRSLRP
jgi:hypothetical protein